MIEDVVAFVALMAIGLVVVAAAVWWNRRKDALDPTPQQLMDNCAASEHVFGLLSCEELEDR